MESASILSAMKGEKLKRTHHPVAHLVSKVQLYAVQKNVGSLQSGLTSSTQELNLAGPDTPRKAMRRD